MNNIVTESFSTKGNVLLALASALLLGCSFPPIPAGFLACIGFVPLLILVDRLDKFGRFFRYSYGTFFLFCAMTLYWVGGFTHLRDPYLMLAGGALLLVLPFIFTLVLSLYYLFRTSTGSPLAVLIFPFLWVSFEWLFAFGEFSFPWLTLGNTQTYFLSKIQVSEVTGVYGLSLWILVLNVVIYVAYIKLQSHPVREHPWKIILVCFGIVVLYMLPDLYGMVRLKDSYSAIDSLTIGIEQPNVDPWGKWERGSSLSDRWHQVKQFLEVIDDHRKDSLDMAVLPESAILFNLPSFPDQYREYRAAVDTMGISILSGYAKVKYYEKANAPVSANIIHGTSLYYDSYNSILLTQPGRAVSQSYSKMRLVPFAERIPYAESVPFLIEPLRWGVGISNWGKGEDSTIFHDERSDISFLAMVCYESIYPEFVASFVKNGAEFLIFITNDSWWGNTSGARQHKQYAVLRAVENRRWVVRCANGGISCFIDPTGRIFDETKMYTSDFIHRTIEARSELTFYSVHGDWIARYCFWITIIIFFISIGYSIISKVNYGRTIHRSSE